MAVFGRTNEALPAVWLGLRLPSTGEDGIERLVDAAVSSRRPLEVSRGTSLWGRFLGNASNYVAVFLDVSLDRAHDRSTAGDSVSQALVGVLSSLGRTMVDLAILPVDRALEEHQIDGALATLEAAREEGLVRHFGLSSRGPALATLAVWQFRDAFEVLAVPSEGSHLETLGPVAQARRVGVVLHGGYEPGPTWEPNLSKYTAPELNNIATVVGVRSAEQVRFLEQRMDELERP